VRTISVGTRLLVLFVFLVLVSILVSTRVEVNQHAIKKAQVGLATQVTQTDAAFRQADDAASSATDAKIKALGTEKRTTGLVACLTKPTNNGVSKCLGLQPGAPGQPGTPGAPGTPGRPGEAAQGLLGPPGPKGAPGDSVTGESGADGKDGATGAAGESGADGKDGAPGADGKDGKDGAPGADSVVPGPAGPAGPAGADSVVAGPAGPQGPLPTSFTIAINGVVLTCTPDPAGAATFACV
jgi:hypothetical protein